MAAKKSQDIAAYRLSESQIQKQVIEALRRLDVYVLRVNSGGHLGRVKLAPTGTPDLIGYLPPNGQMFALEVKADRGKLSEAQEAWAERARKAGVLVGVVRSAQEACDLICSWSRVAC